MRAICQESTLEPLLLIYLMPIMAVELQRDNKKTTAQSIGWNRRAVRDDRQRCMAVLLHSTHIRGVDVWFKQINPYIENQHVTGAINSRFKAVTREAAKPIWNQSIKLDSWLLKQMKCSCVEEGRHRADWLVNVRRGIGEIIDRTGEINQSGGSETEIPPPQKK